MQRFTTAILVVALISCSRDSSPQATTDTAGSASKPEATAAAVPERAPENRQATVSGDRNVVIESAGSDGRFRVNPLTLTGTARTFENNVVIELLDDSGSPIRTTSVTATGDLGSINPWSAELLVTRWPGDTMTIRAIEHSMKDGSERSVSEATLRNETEPIDVTIHWARQNPDNDCTVTNPVNRTVPKSRAMAALLMQILLHGPTDEERTAGATSPFSRGTIRPSLSVANGVLTVAFGQEMQNVGGACRAQAIRSVVEQTMLELPTVDRVRITAGGSEDLALNP